MCGKLRKSRFMKKNYRIDYSDKILLALLIDINNNCNYLGFAINA